MQLALDRVSSTRTRIEREFDFEAVRQMKARAGCDITVGGAELAAHAIQAELVDERRFGSGVVHLRYRTRT